jgi:hypothetical protein
MKGRFGMPRGSGVPSPIPEAAAPPGPSNYTMRLGKPDDRITFSLH